MSITRSRIAIGFATPADVNAADLVLELSRQSTAGITGRISLREKFIAGDLTAELVEQQDLQARALAAQNAAQARLAAAQKALDYLSNRRTWAGDVSNLEISEAQLTVANLQVDLEIAKAELAALQAVP